MAINSNFDELAVTTIENRRKSFADNVTQGNALLLEIEKSGNIMTASGGTKIMQEVDIVENGTFQYYAGYENFNIAPSETLSAAEFNWKQAAVVVSVSGLETDVVNAGAERQMELLAGRITNAERTMKNNLSVGVYSNGAGSGGKQIDGLEDVVQNVATASQTTVGNIDPQTYTNWGNQQVDYGTNTGQDFLDDMNELMLDCTFGNESPNVIVAGSTAFQTYWSALQAIQRITTEERGGAGFRTVMYAGGVPVYYENAGIDATYAYFLNTNFLHWRPHPSRNMTPLPKRDPVNQDASIYPIVFAGNLTCSGRRYQGVLWT